LHELLLEYPDQIYIVGGAVRDAWLHHPIQDIDLATSGSGSRLARYITAHLKGDFFVLDDERDVGRALVETADGKMIIDVARFRGPDLSIDLEDRDFTINAMAVDLKGDLSLLVDPLDGERDLLDKRIRRCSATALSYDPIRALRAVRQSLQFGFRLEPTTLGDIRAVIPGLQNVSAERLRDELFKMLALPRPAAAIRVADALGLLGVIMPEIAPLHGLAQPTPHVHDVWQHTLLVIENLAHIFATLSYSRTDNTAASFGLGMFVIQLDRFRKKLLAHLNVDWPNERGHRALLVLAALLHNVGKAVAASHESVNARLADERAVALRLSNLERVRLVAVVQSYRLPLSMDDFSPLAIHRFWRQVGEAGVDVCLLALADYLGIYGTRLEQDSWLMMVEKVRLLLEAYFEKHDQIIAPAAIIDGNQLMAALNIQSGPIIGRILDHIREAQVTGEVQTREDALRAARAYLEENIKAG
jgi:tRNA nucleotidyltransferase/poly(A) polymerase